MALFFSTTQDEALLALAVQEAQRAEGVRYLGRTALQKVLYFMRVLGVPMDYRFDIHYYGPFCNAILHDTEMLMADDVIVDLAKGERYSNYAPGPNIDEVLGMYTKQLEPHRERVHEVVSVLAPMSREKLELLATLHYAFATEKASGEPGPWKARVLRRFHDFKGDKFSADDVANGYDALVRAGLVV